MREYWVLESSPESDARLSHEYSLARELACFLSGRWLDPVSPLDLSEEAMGQ